jgi:ribosome-binding protein aMBF1 (putative translation factor)
LSPAASDRSIEVRVGDDDGKVNDELARGSVRGTIARRENRDPAYAARMAAARARVGQSVFSDEPNSIAAVRLRMGLSQTKLAEKIGTSQSHIAKIEGGKTRIHFSTAIQLADALAISLDALRPLIEQSSRPIGEPILETQ